MEEDSRLIKKGMALVWNDSFEMKMNANALFPLAVWLFSKGFLK